LGIAGISLAFMSKVHPATVPNINKLLNSPINPSPTIATGRKHVIELLATHAAIPMVAGSMNILANDSKLTLKLRLESLTLEQLANCGRLKTTKGIPELTLNRLSANHSCQTKPTIRTAICSPMYSNRIQSDIPFGL
jgi:hypothetical protein